MRLFVYDMLVNVNVIYEHVCEQVHWARSAGNSAIENLCFILLFIIKTFSFLFVLSFDSIWLQTWPERGCASSW